MINYSSGNMLYRKSGFYRCINENCWFFGIERLDMKKILENDVRN